MNLVFDLFLEDDEDNTIISSSGALKGSDVKRRQSPVAKKGGDSVTGHKSLNSTSNSSVERDATADPSLTTAAATTGTYMLMLPMLLRRICFFIHAQLSSFSLLFASLFMSFLLLY